MSSKLHHLVLELFIQLWRPLANYAVKAAWCICSVKSCVLHAERFRSGVIHLKRYTNGIPLPFTFYLLYSLVTASKLRIS